jgi:hypothetical protein
VKKPIVRVNVDDVVEVVLDVAPVIRDALRKDSPGGRRITREEAEEIGAAVVDALLEQVGDGT